MPRPNRKRSYGRVGSARITSRTIAKAIQQRDERIIVLERRAIEQDARLDELRAAARTTAAHQHTIAAHNDRLVEACNLSTSELNELERSWWLRLGRTLKLVPESRIR